MTKYNKEALDAAEDSVIEAGCHHLTDRAIAAAVFDSLERAPWWEELTDGNTVVPAGCPVRREVATGDATERTYASPFTAWQWLGKARVFIDTRWTPPTPPLAVGDLIETVEQAESLPIGTIAVSRINSPIRKASTDEWRRVDKEALIIDIHMAGQGDRIIYLPSGDSV